MATYYKLNDENKIENTIIAEQSFINSQLDKEKYIRKITNEEESFNSLNDLSYVLNDPIHKTKFDKKLNQYIIEEEAIYIKEKRKFKNPKPYESWIWNEQLFEWEAPYPKPFITDYGWSEKEKKWLPIEINDKGF